MIMQVAALDVLTLKGGFAPEVARAIGEAMDMEIARSRETLATSQQLTEATDLLSERLEEFNRSLNVRIDEVDDSLGRRIDNVERSLGARIDKVEQSLGTRIDDVERCLGARIDKVEHSFGARVDKVEQRIDKLDHSLRTEIAVLSARVDGMVTRSEFDAKFESFRHEIDAKLEKLHTGVVRWVFVVALGFWAAQAGTTVALIRLLVPHAP